MDLNTLIHKAAFGDRGLTLENLDDSLPEGGDSELGSYADSADAWADYGNAMNVAAEAIRDYSIQLEGLIERKELNAVTLGLIRDAAQRCATTVGYEINLPSMESVETQSIEEQGAVALEGFRQVIFNLFQDYVLHFKHHKDVIGDFFRSTSGILNKYEKKTLQNKAEYNSKKNKIGNQEIAVAFVGLDYFLSNTKAMKEYRFSDFMGLLRQDRQMSNFALKEYPKRVLAEIDALAKLLRGSSLKTDADVQKLAKAVEQLKSPSELFDEHLLDVEGFGSSKFVAVKRGGKNRLDVLAAAKPVTLSKPIGATVGNAIMAGVQSFGGRVVASALPVVGATTGGMAHAVAAPVMAARAIYEGVGDDKGKIMLNGSDIGRVLEAAEGYINDVRYFLSTEREVARMIDEMEGAVKAAEAKGQADAKAEDAGEHAMGSVHLYEKILAVSRVLMRAVQTPAQQEVARALKASKYLNYLALRAIFNAKNHAMEGMDNPESGAFARGEGDANLHKESTPAVNPGLAAQAKQINGDKPINTDDLDAPMHAATEGKKDEATDMVHGAAVDPSKSTCDIEGHAVDPTKTGETPEIEGAELKPAKEAYTEVEEGAVGEHHAAIIDKIYDKAEVIPSEGIRIHIVHDVCQIEAEFDKKIKAHPEQREALLKEAGERLDAVLERVDATFEHHGWDVDGKKVALEGLMETAKSKKAKFKGANDEEIAALEKAIGFKLPVAYRKYLKDFGYIACGGNEVYGAARGHLSAVEMYEDLSRSDTFPKQAIPLMEIGDGHYYILNAGKVVEWANGGIVKSGSMSFTDFLEKKVFED
jgi:hypothetical protein